MDCVIVRIDTGSEVQLMGRVRSDVAAHVHYCLTIASSGQNASTTLAEIGDVDVAANTPTEFGHTMLQKPIGLDAHLVVTWKNGKVECDLVSSGDV